MARAEARGVDAALARRPVRVRPAARRRAVPRRRRRGVAGPTRRRPGSLRGRRRPRACRPTCARATGCSQGGSHACFDRYAGPGRLHPHPCRRHRSSRSASACSAPPMRSLAARAGRSAGRRAGQPVAGDDPDRPPVRLPLRWLARARRRAPRRWSIPPSRREPDVVVVTGDLSADGRPSELEEVAHELARFGGDPAWSSSRATATSSRRSGRRAKREACRSIRTSTTSWPSSRR